MSSRNKKKPLSDDDLANAKRLKEIWVREKGNLTQAKAAEIMGFESQGAVSHYLNGRSALNVAAVLKFSSLLNIPPENIAPNLDYGCNGLRVIPESNIIPTAVGGLIPLISFVQAGDWAECIDNFAPGDAEDWLPCPSKHSPSTFAVHVKGDSMTAPFGRTYPEGCIIFVDPEQEARAGDRVIAKLTDVNEATFKVLIEDNGMTFLKPLNPQYHTMQINGNCKIVGKVIGSYFPE